MLVTKKLEETGHCPHSLVPHLPSLISAAHTLLFSSSSITSHLVSISQGPLSALPAYYGSSMWVGRKSLEQGKPFISRGDLICVLHFGECTKLSLQWSEANFSRTILLSISLYVVTKTKKCVLYMLPAFPSPLTSSDAAVCALSCSPACCQSALCVWIFGISFALHSSVW